MPDILTITTDPDGILRKRAMRVSDVTAPDMRTLVADMVDIMRESDGVGLAAPQIGRSVRVFVTEVDGRISVFFNPVITTLSDKTIDSEEGCLSIPDMFSVIRRSERIRMEYVDQNGERKKIEAEGFFATVLQHEYDHLDGILFTDRLEPGNTSGLARKSYAF